MDPTLYTLETPMYPSIYVDHVRPQTRAQAQAILGEEVLERLRVFKRRYDVESGTGASPQQARHWLYLRWLVRTGRLLP